MQHLKKIIQHDQERLSQECKTELTSKNQTEYTIFIRKKLPFQKTQK